MHQVSTSAFFVIVKKWNHPEPGRERGWSVHTAGHGSSVRPPVLILVAAWGGGR